MTLHQKDWIKLGLGSALLGMTGGMAGIGIPGLMGAGADAAGATAGGMAAAGAPAALAAQSGLADAGAGAASSAGFGHALTSLGMEAGKDAAKGAIVRGMLSPLTQQKATIYGQPMSLMQQQDPMSMFPRQ